MSSRITYENKKALQNDENVARENKVTDLDLNEIKEVVNSHANDIENFKNYDDTEVKQDIINIKQEQEAQNTDIEALQSSISEINEKNNAQDEEIEALKQENTVLKKTQDNMIEKQLNKETEADTSVIAKDSDEFYGKLSIFGGQRQEKRQGYNLVNIKNCALGAVTKEDIDDTSFIATTMNTSPYRLINFPLGTLKIGNYTISIESLEILEGTATDSTGVVQLYKDGTFVRNIKLNENSKQTFQITEESEYLIKYLLIGTTAAEQNIKIKATGLMIYEGTEEKPYEPFGVMPSLGYPSEIEAVGDNVNLFNKDTISENKYINLGNGVLGNSTTSNTSDYIKVCANEEYVLSYEYETLIATGKRVCCYFDENKNYIKGIEYTSTNKETVFLSSQNGYIRFSYDINAYNVKLEKGTKATSYSEYGQGSVEISTSNKNVLAFKDFEYTEKGITIKCKNNKIHISGTATSAFTIFLTEHCNIKDLNKIIMDKKVTLSSNVPSKAELNVNAKGESYYIQNKSNMKSVSKTILKELSSMGIYIGEGAATFEQDFDIQLELDELSNYTPHKGETYIMPIQQKMYEGDTFEQIDGVWYEKHSKAYVELTGDRDIIKVGAQIGKTTAWQVEDVNSNYKRFSEFGYASHFQRNLKSGMYSAKDQEGWNIESNRIRFRVNAEQYATVESVKALIKEEYKKGTPFAFAFEYVEPILLKCTSEQCKILDKIDTYKDGTIITTDNDLCKISLRYKEDYDKRITALEKQINTATEVAESE